MNSYLRIMVRVVNQGTAEMKALQGQVASLQAQVAKANMATGAWGGAMGRMPLDKWGKSMQWTGRQIEYNFTLPIVAAGAAAVHFALQNEAAMVRISKVYGDASTGTQQFAKDQKALGKAMEALSDIFGVNQAAVLNVAADWAEAGATGVALAKATRLTLEASVLGEMDTTTATTALISIQQQYGQTLDDNTHSTKSLHGTLAILNMVENQTAITMQGLIEGFTRSASAARTAGIDVRTLAALLAAMVPASGSATTAGNAIKTMLSRLLAPTKAAVDLLGQLGFNINTAGWQSKTGSERLVLLAQSFEKLTHGQQAIVSSTIASRFQINRFDTLMRAIVNPTSNYAKALKSTADQTVNLAQYQRELGQVLGSNPQAFKILTVQLENALARAVVPLIPALLAVMSAFTRMVDGFTNLPAPVQKLIIGILGLLAVVGPLLRYLGASVLLFYELGKGVPALLRMLGLLGVANEGLTATQLAMISSAAAAQAELDGLSTAEAAAAGAAAANAAANDANAKSYGGLFTVLREVLTLISWPFLTLMNGFFRLGAVIAEFAATVAASLGALVTKFLAGDFVAGVQTAFRSILFTAEQYLAPLIAAVQVAFLSITNTIYLALANVYESIIAWGTTTLATFTAWGTALLATVSAAMTAFIAAPLTSLAELDAVFLAWAASSLKIFVVWAAELDATVLAALQKLDAVVLGALARLDAAFFAWASETMATFVAWAAELDATVLGALARLDAAVLAWVGEQIAAFTLWAAELDAKVLQAMAAFLAAPLATLAELDAAFFAWFSRNLAAFLVWAAELDAVVLAAMAKFARGVLISLTETSIGFTAWIGEMIAGFGIWIASITASVVPLFLGSMRSMMAGFATMSRYIITNLVKLSTALLEFSFRTIPAMLGPWGLLVVGVVALIIAFRSQIVTVFTDIGNFIIKVFNLLPESVKNAMEAVFRIVEAAAQAIGTALGHLNPFQRHSPSLVDNVHAGTKVISSHYQKMSAQVVSHAAVASTAVQSLGADTTNAASSASSVKTPISTVKTISQPGLKAVEQGADKALQAFNAAIKPAQLELEAKGFADMRKQIVAMQASAGPAVDALTAAITRMEARLPKLAAAVAAQQSVVDGWQKKLDNVSAALDKANTKLNALQKTASDSKDALDASKQALADLAATPITGMKAMSDAIFDNSMQQKALQLEIYKTEDAFGSLDDIKSKYAAINGEILKLRGEENDLRAAGAGSDVLGTYDTQIKGLQNTQAGMQSTSNTITTLQDQLTKLQKTGQELDLEQSLAFDPLTKQINDFINAAQELPFSQIMAGLVSTQAAVNQNQAAYDAATAAVTKQQNVVDSLTVSRDKIQASFDKENKKLTDIKNNYDALTSSISSAKQALNDFSSSASQAAAAKAAAAGGSALAGAGTGDFADPGGSANLTATGDLQKTADEWAKEVEKSFGSFSIFGPIRKEWDKGWAWLNKETDGRFQNWATSIKKHWKFVAAGAGVGLFFGPLGVILGAGIGSALGMINWKKYTQEFKKKFSELTSGLSGSISGSPLGGFADGVVKAADLVIKPLSQIVSGFKLLAKAIEEAWKIIGPTVTSIGHLIGTELGNLVETVIKHFEKWKDLGKPLIEALGHIYVFIRDALIAIAAIVAVEIAAVLEVWKIAWAFFGPVVKPILDAVIKVIGFAINAIHDIIKFVLDLINGDWSKAFGDLWALVLVFWNLIITYFVTIGKVFVGVVHGIIDGVVAVWSTLWSLIGPPLSVVGSNIKDVFDKIGSALKFVWEHVMVPVWNAFTTVWQDILIKPMGALVGFFAEVWNGIGSALKAVKRDVMDPVWNSLITLWDKVLKSPMQALLDGMFTLWNGIGAGVAGGVNIAIGAIDKLISAINWVGSHLPGLSFHIPAIGQVSWTDVKPPKLETGGVVGPGFRTNGVRAIVGEGNPRYPEYVIPTDPKYRGNAQRLIVAAMGDLHRTGGLRPGAAGWGVPAHDGGGILGGIGGIVKDIGGAIRKGAVEAAFAAPLAAFDAANKFVPNKPYPLHDILNSWKNDVYNWAKGQGNAKLGADLVGAGLRAGSGHASGGVIPALAMGGIVRRRMGGTLVRLGEGQNDEAVTPLPSGGVGATHHHQHTYGNLVFPNVKNGDDARELIKNLQALAAS